MNDPRPQYIIFKADDIREHSESPLSPGWSRFIEYIVQSEVTAALGLIGNSLQEPTGAYVDRLREISADSRFEFWNHGYDHVLKKAGADGRPYSEFHQTSLEHQRVHLNQTQQLTCEHLGLTLTTFGAPGNLIDESTLTAVDEHPEIEIWLYGDARSKKHILGRTINVEHPVHYPDFDAFKGSYIAELPILTLQLHPGGWDDDRFANFESIVAFLKQRDCIFTNPTRSVTELQK